MTNEATVNFFKDPAEIARNEAEARRKAVEAFVAKGGKIKIGTPAPTPRRMTANP
jgi:hypothetical protein